MASAFHGVFSRLVEAGKNPTHALANRVVFRKETCTISSLSPGDEVFQRFLTSVRGLIPKQGGNKTRIRSLSPNEAAVSLWVDTGDFTLLLGADLEKSGWVAVVESPTRSTDPTRSTEKASALKVPHHGSENADEPTVWQQMLESDPLAVLTPWRRGGHALPTAQDVVRILAATQNAYVTDNGLPRQNPRHRNSAVTRTLRESGSRFRRLTAITVRFVCGVTWVHRRNGRSKRWGAPVASLTLRRSGTMPDTRLIERTSRRPAHGSRWKRFVTPFLPPDFHRLSTSELA